MVLRVEFLCIRLLTVVYQVAHNLIFPQTSFFRIFTLLKHKNPVEEASTLTFLRDLKKYKKRTLLSRSKETPRPKGPHRYPT